MQILPKVQARKSTWELNSSKGFKISLSYKGILTVVGVGISFIIGIKPDLGKRYDIIVDIAHLTGLCGCLHHANFAESADQEKQREFNFF